MGLVLRLDAFGGTAPRLCWAETPRAALEQLRAEHFDVLVVVHDDPGPIVAALRTGAVGEPIVVCSRTADDGLWIEAGRWEYEPFVADDPWQSPALLPTIGRAIERHELRSEHGRLAVERENRIDRERREAEHILRQQQRILSGLTSTGAKSSLDESPMASPRDRMHDEVRRYYQELLRAFVIMGAGGMGSEIAEFAQMLAEAGIGPREALELHLERVDELVRGLGNRSTRHVLDRADLLALELVVHLGEYLHRVRTTA